MKLCKKCIHNNKCNPKYPGTYTQAKNCKHYKWVGDGKTYNTPDGPRKRGHRPFNLEELIALNKRRTSNDK